MTLIDRRNFLALAAAAATMGGAAWAREPGGLEVTTRRGRIRGRREGGIRLFTGIPYAQAARFAAPRPSASWSDVRDATGRPAIAPQATSPTAPVGPRSEDCLQLNVWTPAGPGPHPVLVHIHGGGNEGGWSGDEGIAGDRFAQHGVVCVTVNYRLGALGFLETGEQLGAAYAGSVNNGMRDLLAALHWVRANIAAFGGDPSRVTIAGASAGGKNVGTLMGMPDADGLYAGAALFSGGGETVHTLAEARAFARLFAAKLGGGDRLLTAPVDAILAAQAAVKTAWPRNFPFRPAVDGKLLPQVPLARIKAGRGRAVPMLIGTNTDESRLFLSPAQAAAGLREQAIANESMARMTALDAAYARAFPALSAAERHWRLLTAEEYSMPCLRLAEGHAARGAAVFRYRLTYPAPGGPFAGSSPHALDGSFVFDHVTRGGLAALFGLTRADQPMADMMHGAMVRFVGEGRPSAPQLPAWRRFDTVDRQTMVLDRAPALVADPDRAERLLWLD